MRRRRTAGVVAVLAAAAVVAVATSGSGPHARLHVTPRKTFTACVSGDCGPWAATLNWSLPSFPNTTGYWLFLNGSQVGSAASSPFTFYGSDCGVTNTLGVEAHDASSNHGPLWTTDYASPACPGSPPSLLTEPVVSGTVATANVLSTSNGSWNNTPSSFTYQWQDCATDGTGCTNITGATSSSYTVAAGDAGHTIEAVVTAHNASGATSAGAPIVPLVDEFNGSSIDTNVWHVMNQQGDTSGNEQECYEPSQAAESGGFLTEQAIFVSGGFTCPSGTPSDPACTGACATVASGGTAHYKSAAVQEIGTAFTYGTITARIKLGGLTGSDADTWPAIWLLGAACQGPTSWLTGTPPSTGAFYCPWSADAQDAAEIDIAEDNTQGDTSVRENLFNSSATNHGCISGTISDIHANYHVYELDWTAGSMIFKIDGVTQTGCTVTGSSVPSHPMFVIVQQALQPTPTSSNLPFTNSIDYVHVSH